MKKFLTITLVFISAACQAQDDYQNRIHEPISEHFTNLIFIWIIATIISFAILYHIIKEATKSKDTMKELRTMNANLAGILQASGKKLCTYCRNVLGKEDGKCEKCGESV